MPLATLLCLGSHASAAFVCTFVFARRLRLAGRFTEAMLEPGKKAESEQRLNANRRRTQEEHRAGVPEPQDKQRKPRRCSGSLSPPLPVHETGQSPAGWNLAQHIPAVSGGPRRPFRSVPEVLSWHRSFAQLEMRYQFLVLEGGSCLGKTQYSLSLGYNIYRCDCAGCEDPPMSGFAEAYHDGVLFDDASAKLLLRQTRLCQAGLSWVTLGKSATNDDSFKIWPYRKNYSYFKVPDGRGDEVAGV